MRAVSTASVLFVCMGNICRSPMAEAVFRHQAREAGLVVEVDSAGTHAYHVGEPPHPETLAELARRGIPQGEHRARLVTAADLERFDHVVAMDRANLGELRALAAAAPQAVRAELSLLLDHAPDEVDEDEVPDPWYVGGYDHVFDLVTLGGRGLLEHVRGELEEQS